MTPTETKHEHGSNVATIAATVIALVALLVSIYTYAETFSLQKKIAAFTFWQSYLQLAVEEPGYANGKFDSGNPEDRERYEWFAANALGTAETVYLLQEGDPDWENTIRTLIRIHRDYIDELDFERSHYSSSFKDLIDKTLDETQE